MASNFKSKFGPSLVAFTAAASLGAGVANAKPSTPNAPATEWTPNQTFTLKQAPKNGQMVQTLTTQQNASEAPVVKTNSFDSDGFSSGMKFTAKLGELKKAATQNGDYAAMCFGHPGGVFADQKDALNGGMGLQVGVVTTGPNAKERAFDATHAQLPKGSVIGCVDVPGTVAKEVPITTSRTADGKTVVVTPALHTGTITPNSVQTVTVNPKAPKVATVTPEAPKVVTVTPAFKTVTKAPALGFKSGPT